MRPFFGRMIYSSLLLDCGQPSALGLLHILADTSGTWLSWDPKLVPLHMYGLCNPRGYAYGMHVVLTLDMLQCLSLSSSAAKSTHISRQP